MRSGESRRPDRCSILELGQAVLGGILVLGVLGLAERITGGSPRASLAAGVIASVHPALVYAATHVQVALLGATLLTWTLLRAYRAGASGRTVHAVVAGALLALMALTDPILALALPGVIWAIVRGGRAFSGPSGALRLSALVVTVAALGVLPWILRNACVHGEFVAIKSSFGYAFWQGNCNLSEGTDKVVRPSVDRVLERRGAGRGLSELNRTLWAARHEAGYIDDIALTREDKESLGIAYPSPSGRASSSAGRSASCVSDRHATWNFASGGSATSGSSTRPIPRPGCWPIESAISGS